MPGTLLTHSLGLRIEHETRSALSRHSACVPHGAVLLSNFNRDYLRLHELQFQRVGHLRCLLTRVVLVCHGAGSSYGTCIEEPGLPASSNGTGVVQQTAWWVKWFMIVHSLRASARSAMFLDTDVVVLQNPFRAELAALVAPQSGGRSFDMLYQEEMEFDPWARLFLQPTPNRSLDSSSADPSALGHATTRICCTENVTANPINTGQLLVRSLSLAERVLANAMPTTFDQPTRNDQDLVFEKVIRGAVARGEYRVRGLPVRFASHCWRGLRDARQDAHSMPFCELVSYHACCTAGLWRKAKWMNIAINGTAYCRRVEGVG